MWTINTTTFYWLLLCVVILGHGQVIDAELQSDFINLNKDLRSCDFHLSYRLFSNGEFVDRLINEYQFLQAWTVTKINNSEVREGEGSVTDGILFNRVNCKVNWLIDFHVTHMFGKFIFTTEILRQSTINFFVFHKDYITSSAVLLFQNGFRKSSAKIIIINAYSFTNLTVSVPHNNWKSLEYSSEVDVIEYWNDANAQYNYIVHVARYHYEDSQNDRHNSQNCVKSTYQLAKYYRDLDCGEIERVIEHLKKAFSQTGNVTFVYKNSKSIQQWEDLYNDIDALLRPEMFVSGFEIFYPFSSRYVIRELKTMAFIYCEDRIKLESFSLKVWIDNYYDRLTWVLILVSFLAGTLFTKHVKFLKKRNFLYDISSVLFFTICLIMRQYFGTKNRVLIVILVFMSIIIFVGYETHMTSQVIAPGDVKVYGDLPELLEAGFKLIMYVGTTHAESFAANTFWHTAFKKHKILHKFNKEFVVEMNYSTKAFYLLVETERKLFALQESDTVDKMMYELEKHNSMVKCHEVEETIPGTPLSWRFIYAHFDRVAKLFDWLTEIGLTGMFYQNSDFVLNYSVRNSLAKKYFSNIQPEKLNLNMKFVTVFTLLYYGFAFSSVAFGMEIFVGVIVHMHRKYREFLEIWNS